MADNSTFDPQAVSNILEEMVPFIKKVGIKVKHIAPREATCTLPADPSNMNHIGTFHAGAIFTLAETAGGAIMIASFDMTKYRLVIRSAEINYKKPSSTELSCSISMPEAEVSRVLAEVDTKGKIDLPVKMALTDSAGTVIAEVTAIYNIKKLS